MFIFTYSESRIIKSNPVEKKKVSVSLNTALSLNTPLSCEKKQDVPMLPLKGHRRQKEKRK